jgi:hypothetical protein
VGNSKEGEMFAQAPLVPREPHRHAAPINPIADTG